MHDLFSSITWNLIIYSTLIIFIARAIQLFICTIILNIFRKNTKISYKWMFVMWISGLRGAVAFCLAVEA